MKVEDVDVVQAYYTGLGYALALTCGSIIIIVTPIWVGIKVKRWIQPNFSFRVALLYAFAYSMMPLRPLLDRLAGEDLKRKR